MYDNCDVDITEQKQIVINNCNIGTITRTFLVNDPQGLISRCVQTIEIINDYPFNIDSIDWPLDYETNLGCNVDALDPDSLPAPYNMPVIRENECSLVGVSYEDEVFEFVPNEPACFKIIRTWKVIDWCQFRRGQYQIWTWDQILKINNLIAPTVTCTDTMICSYDPECDPIRLNHLPRAMDDCTPEDEIFWTWKLDLHDDGSIDDDGIGRIDDYYEVGEHRIYWVAEDKCGNQTLCDHIYELRNCKAPTAYCINGLTADLIPMDLDMDGTPDAEMVELWASDFDAGSSHTCDYDVFLSFSSDTSDKRRVYDCDSIGQRTVELWVTDEHGNTSRCLTYIIITDNNNVNVCGGNLVGVVNGNVSLENNVPLPNVEIDLSGSGLPSIVTDDDGNYAFPGMPYGGQYQVNPAFDNAWMNGVSTLDLVKMQKHILGIEHLVSPYRILAADVNRSGSVTARDLVDLRKLILGSVMEIQGNTSWRFVPKGTSFADPNEPFAEGETENFDISDLQGDVTADFIAYKVGDMNGSAKTFFGSGLETRSGEMAVVELPRIEFEKGEFVQIPIYLTDKSLWTGLQFTLNWNMKYLHFESVKYDENLENGHGFGLQNTDEAALSFSWVQVMQDVDSDSKLMTLSFTALADGSSEGLFEIGSSITRAEAYGNYETVHPISLQLRESSEIHDQVELQVYTYPNPWKYSVTMEVLVAERGEGILQVFDQSGRTVLVRSLDLEEGMNRVILHENEIDGAGVFYYRLLVNNHIHSDRMIKIH